MNSFDIVLIIPLILGIYNGFKKGFITELVSSSLLVLGLIKGVSLFYALLPIIVRRLPAVASCIPVSTCLAILLLVIGGGVIYLLTTCIRSILRITFLGIFDNLLGAAFGFCKSAFCISMLLYAWSYVAFTPLSSAYMHNSTLVSIWKDRLQPIIPKLLPNALFKPAACIHSRHWLQDARKNASWKKSCEMVDMQTQ